MAFAKVTTDSTSKSQKSYGKAGAIANEVLSSIRSVTAYGGQKEEIVRYEEHLQEAYKSSVKKAHISGICMGLTMFVLVSVYAVAFYYGSRLVKGKQINVGDVITVFFAVIMGSMGIGQGAPCLESFSAAQGAAPRLFEVIERKSSINPRKNEGTILDSVKGSIEFRNVCFKYDERHKKMVLDDLNISIPSGTTLALVGASGCGKSTTVSLIERFYDVTEGAVLIDDVDVKDMNVQWLRSQIGYVAQMPTLFGTTIKENIALGAPVEPVKEPQTGKVSMKRRSVSDEEIIEAAKMANAHKFIMRLSDGYDTILGSGTSQLSGGQKQRVAIARALIRKPRILLLDEATSALDAGSERAVQEAIDRVQQGRTTIIIAHRLSTVKNADVIAVVDEGRIVERGSHAELIRKQDGVYKKLVELQNIQGKKQTTESDETTTDDDSFIRPQLLREQSRRRRSSLGGTSMSLVDVLDTESDDEDEQRSIDKGIFRRTLRENPREIPFMVLGATGAAVTGAIWPVIALIFTEVVEEISLVAVGKGNEGRIRFWVLMFLVVALLALISNYVFLTLNGISGARLTRRMRSETFKAFLRQEMGFFDKKENQTGSLTSQLSVDATLVKGLTGDTFGATMQALSTILIGLGIAFTGCWRVALSVLAVIPGVVVGGFFQMKMMTGFDSDSRKNYAVSGAIATEAVSNIRTVAALGIQDHFTTLYGNELDKPLKNGLKASQVLGIAFGVSELCVFLIFLVGFGAGAKFVDGNMCDFNGLMRAITGLVFASMTLGNISIFMPDISASRVAATKIYRHLDRVSEINPSTEQGSSFQQCNGKISIDNAEFAYPRRPELPVLRGLSTSVDPTRTLALVGESGSGKSTVVSLVERFYDPSSGEVLFDGKDLKDLNLQHARSHIGIVSQEPDLFNRSVRDNIAYGFPKNEGTVITEAAIIEAAQAANAHNFIQRLPQGYDTLCGERGSRLSGGQCQRIAIARSLVRNPVILLLDEATSALDSRSERIVQDALDRARSGRTTIVIAHRLSTIRNADQICVVERGQVAEHGTHDELMSFGGAYANLVQNQMCEEPESGTTVESEL
eukprot:Plantae.Rhodophyta-Hildenbrandia_rubra.ctg9612.p1 GENE.Plantae.Rhodophyta-Hildenbrandia_rubra.ctg9612~~Plantae.Rhodophyta-Hildenbrandia_rubra.ctg9612.p1  ORF type:complete len:1208 (+),score=197.04 Plantae.Rhodophyta-Hildenbrandia_rubra.ctg9612:383-3625(+)